MKKASDKTPDLPNARGSIRKKELFELQPKPVNQ